MKKLKLNSSPYIVKNTNYSTITFVIYYPYKYDKIHMYDLELINQLVMNYSYEYKSEQEFRKEKVKRLIIGFNCTIKTIHNNLFVIFTLTVPNPKIVKNFDIEDAFKFFYNTIYNPNIVNGEFDHNQFQREKEYIKFSIQNALKNISCDSYQRFIKYVDDIGDLKNNVYNNLELLEDSNPKSLYEYYKNIIINNSPVCIVYGDIDKDFIENLYYKYFKKIENEIIFDIDYDTYNEGAKYISYLLTPATVCLAVPLYRQLQLLKDNLAAVVIGIVSGVAASLLSVFGLSKLFGLNHQMYVSLLPKSITTAIGMGVSEELGGIVTITVAVIIITGILGNAIAEVVFRIFRIYDPIARGLGLGTSAHAIGTAKAMELGAVEGAMSSLAIAVAGLMTVIFASAASGLM